jgi:hypothetical protein
MEKKRPRIKKKKNIQSENRKITIAKPQQNLKRSKLRLKIQKEIKRLTSSSKSSITLDEKKNRVKKDIISLESSIKKIIDPRVLKKSRLALLKLQTELKNIEQEQFNSRIKKSLKPGPSINKALRSPNKISELNTTSKGANLFNNYPITDVFEAEWDNVIFHDGRITIKHNLATYERYIRQSKKYLNEIKQYYKIHNVPKLLITVKNSRITIENEEILFYHIDFLSVSAANFGYIKLPKLDLNNWSKYTKSHYITHLPFLFHNRTLQKLCEYCDSNLPIVPVGEVIINSYGASKIDNSFLFPIKSRNGYLVVWESVEEGKASYVFLVDSYTNENVQNLFDYIAGDRINKRSTLFYSRELQTKLNMKDRLLHTDLHEWEYRLKRLI